jgi:hypothetical protein
MKTIIAAIVGTVVLSTALFAQERVPGSDKQVPAPGQTSVSAPKTRDPHTTTGQGPVSVPGVGNPFGAKGGATGAPNPDRVPTPGN